MKSQLKPSPYICPTCGHVNNAATSLSEGQDDTLEPGAIGICFTCTALSMVQDDLSQRPLSDVEFEGLPLQTKILIGRAQRAIVSDQRQVSAHLN